MKKTPEGKYYVPTNWIVILFGIAISIAFIVIIANALLNKEITEPLQVLVMLFIILGAIYNAYVFIKRSTKSVFEMNKEGILINDHLAIPWKDVSSIEVVEKYTFKTNMRIKNYYIAVFAKDQDKYSSHMSKRMVAEYFAFMINEDRIAALMSKIGRNKKQAQKFVEEVNSIAKREGWLN